MAKKVGILTFHSAVNYGAVLQAAALNRKLTDLGIDNELINYEDEEFRQVYGIQNKFDVTNKVVRLGLLVVKNIMFQMRKRKFISFLKSYTTLSSAKYTEANIKASVNNYSKIITGSDQVWNMNLTGGDKSYFLDYVPEDKMMSYAASFGFSKLPDNLNRDEYASLLSRFDNPSIREDSGCDLYKELTGKASLQHVDPTLLLTGDEWAKHFELKNSNKRKYILVYTVAVPVGLISHIEEIAREQDLDIIEITPKFKTASKLIKAKHFCGPKDFLNLIYNAEMVATTSFHATVFSMLFHKKVSVELLDKNNKRNVRIESLLKLVGHDYDGSSDIVDVFDVDYNKVDTNLESERQRAFAYLKNAEERI